MDSSSEDENLVLPSTEELQKAAGADIVESNRRKEKKKKKKEEKMSESSEDDGDSISSSKDSISSSKETKSPKKMHRTGIMMAINETSKEMKYRRKNFPDPDEVLSYRKLRCTSCCAGLQAVVSEGRDVYHHPVLKVLMCKACVEFYGDGDFSVDEDGSDRYCRWCAQGGTLYCCATCCCAFCRKCIKRNLSRTILVDIESEEWKCFICNGEPLWELRAICANAHKLSKKIQKKKREDNERNLRHLQKKRVPGKDNSRRLNRWQKNAQKSSSDNTSDSDDSTSSKDSDKGKKKRKRGGSESEDKSKSKKAKVEDLDSDVAIVEVPKECITVTDGEEENIRAGRENKSSSKNRKENVDKISSLPDAMDSEDIKESHSLLNEHLSDLIATGELLVYRAQRIQEKKVVDENLSESKNIKQLVDRIKLLSKLAGDNLQQTSDSLTKHYRKWSKQVIKRQKVKGRKEKEVAALVNGVKEENKADSPADTKQSDEAGATSTRVEEDEVDEEPQTNEEPSINKGTKKGSRKREVINGDSSSETDNMVQARKKTRVEPENNKDEETDVIQGNEAELSGNETEDTILRKTEKHEKTKTEDSERTVCNVDHSDGDSEDPLKGIVSSDDTPTKQKEVDTSEKSFQSLTTININENISDVDLFSSFTEPNEDEKIEENESSDKGDEAEKEPENIPKGSKEKPTADNKSDDDEDDGGDDDDDAATIEFVCSQDDAESKDEADTETNSVSLLADNTVTKKSQEDNDDDDDDDSVVNEDANILDPLALSNSGDESNMLEQMKSPADSTKETIKCSKTSKDSDAEDSDVDNNNCKVDAGQTDSKDAMDDGGETDSKDAVDDVAVGEADGKDAVDDVASSETDSKDDVASKVEPTETTTFTDDCIEAHQALLSYSDDEDEEEEPKKKVSRKKQKKMKLNNDENTKEEVVKPKKRPGPKSKTRIPGISSSSSSGVSDDESDDSSGTLKARVKGTKKQKLRLKDLEALKLDKKLQKCYVKVDRISEEEFQKFYEQYYSDEDDDDVDDYREIKKLTNLKSLKKSRGNISDASDDNDSDNSEKTKKKRKKKDKKKEQEERLIDFFNKEDENEIADEGDKEKSDGSTSESDAINPTTKKNFVDKVNEMALKLLNQTCSDDSNDSDEDILEDDTKKKNKKEKNQDKDVKDDDDSSMPVNDLGDEKDKKEDEEEEEEAEENEKPEEEAEENEKPEEEAEENDKPEEEEAVMKEEVKADKDVEEEEDPVGKEEETFDKIGNVEEDEDKKEDKGKDSSDESATQKKKKNWRKDRLLTEKLSDLDTSDEERLWSAKKEKEKKLEEEENDSDVVEVSPKKKKVRRRLLGSDDDEESVKAESSSESESNQSSDSDIFVIKKKKKKSTKKGSSDDDSDSESDTKKKKSRRKRIKAPASDSSSDNENEPGQKSDTPGKGRKKIHHIMSDDNVAEATRRAAKEEEERRKRIADKQKVYNEIYKVVEGVEKLDKLVLDFDPETKKELVSVDQKLVPKLKPHQAKGIKFMWDACFESLKRIKKTKGSGCILAHCMGLGKTFQIVTLVHTLLNHKETGVSTVLVVCPLTTVLNWVNEFNLWLKDGEEVNVFELTRYKQNYERMYQLKDWQESGGVMVLGYDMYRTLTNTQTKRIKKKTMEAFQSTLVDPGPDLVVCDEGHLLKNEDSAIAKAMRRIRTLRRIVLTGTPLQNNLKEYHCMVQFVKPNLLGTRKEFLNRFVNPITNGQFEDSTSHDVKIMKRRAHVLHKMLEGSVQRFDYSVLMPFLPPKHEFVISIRLSEFQVKAYQYYLDHYSRTSENNKGAQLFSDFQNLQRIWTHPRVLQMNEDKAEKAAEKKRLMESDSEGSLRDFIDDDSDASSSTTPEESSAGSDDSDVQIMDNKSKEKVAKASKYTRNTRSKGITEDPEIVELEKNEEKEKPTVWWKQFVQGDEQENINQSGKLVLLFSILRECEKIGDKVLVFSQSLFSLDLIEHFLASIDAATQNDESKEELGKNSGSWSPGLDYFRIDGSSSTENRNIWCKSFNREDNHRARLFLISTRAGGLGINLVAANRVIIFDASWNPSHDVQSIFRVFRFGQKKPCYIYRFLAQGTMEEKIYDRQVTKLSLSCRVVDEQQIERHYNMADLQELYQFDPEQKTKRPTPILPKDRLLAELLKEHEHWIVTYHEHDSLLENKEEEELNEEERKAAWEEYENEKQGKVLVTANMTPTAGLNVAALRDALRKDNPSVTEEQLEQKLSAVLAQVYEYLNAQQSLSSQYTPAHLQALQQFQQQQQIRDQQLRMQQAAGGYAPNASTSFQQYLQNQRPTYPTTAYKNAAVSKSGGFRMQSKLVPLNPNTASTARFPGAPNYYGAPQQNKVQNHHLTRQPVMLPQTSTYQQQVPTMNSMDMQSMIQRMYQQRLNENKDMTAKKSVPNDVIETID